MPVWSSFELSIFRKPREFLEDIVAGFDRVVFCSLGVDIAPGNALYYGVEVRLVKNGSEYRDCSRFPAGGLTTRCTVLVQRSFVQIDIKSPIFITKASAIVGTSTQFRLSSESGFRAAILKDSQTTPIVVLPLPQLSRNRFRKQWRIIIRCEVGHVLIDFAVEPVFPQIQTQCEQAHQIARETFHFMIVVQICRSKAIDIRPLVRLSNVPVQMRGDSGYFNRLTKPIDCVGFR